MYHITFILIQLYLTMIILLLTISVIVCTIQIPERSNICKIKKRETRNSYKLHKQTTTTVHQIPDLGQVQTFAAGLNVLMDPNLLSFSETIA